MNIFKLASLISISLFLSACGGGGSDSSPVPTPSPAATIYTVTATAGEGGSISPSSRSVTSGQTTTFTVTANTGYDIASVTGCGGSLSGSTYTTGTITSACSVSASFTQKSYEVTATASEGGSITPESVSVKHGETTTFAVTANTGYEIEEVTGCGGSLNGNTYITGAITSACSVSASFAQKSYEVTATAGEGGSITPESVSVKHGETTSFTITADDGYDIEDVVGCGGALSENIYTTGSITGACSVDAKFYQPTTTTVSGKVIDGYISGATVFLDLNGNEELDTNEPRAITNDEGDYNLALADEDAQCRPYSALIVDVPVGAVDADFGEVTEAFRLVYPPTLLSEEESTNITPLTTVIWDFYKYQIQHIERGLTEPLSCESLAANKEQFERFSEKVDGAIDEVVRRFNLPRSILFDDYIASEDEATAELGRQIVLGLQRSLRETFDLQQENPDAYVMVNYLRDEISWMKHVYRSTSTTKELENGWLQSGETEAYTDRLTDDFSETIGEREFWLRRGIEKDFDNYKVWISDLQEHCGSMDFLIVNFRDQDQPSFEVEVTNLSEIAEAEADAYCSPRPRGKYVFAPLLNVGENERGSFQMMVRYDEVNERFAAFDDWKDFYERRDTFPYAEMPERLLEWRFDYFDDLTNIDFFQIADSITFTFARYEDGLWVEYRKSGTALGVFGWRETRTVNNADGTRTFFCREADEVEFTSCDIPRYEVSASAGVGGSITPSKRNVLSDREATFTVTPDEGYEIEEVTGCGGSLSGNTYTTGAITSACSIESTFKKLNFTVSVTTSGSGTVSSDELTVPYGESGEITTIPAENYGVYQIEGCDGSFDVSANLYTTGAITENCSISVEFEGVLTGEISGPEVFLIDTDGAFELTTVREVETEWLLSKSPETATAAITEVDPKNVTIASDKNGEYEVSVTMTRGYLSASVEAPFKVATPLSDNIEEDKRLLLSESPYLLTKDIFIRQEKTLSAEPGVELYGDIVLDQFNRETLPEIEVFGTLDFQGESDKKVSIDEVNINPGDTQSSGPYYFIKFGNVLFKEGLFHSGANSGYGHLEIRDSTFKDVEKSINLFWPVKHSYFMGNQFINSGGIRFFMGTPVSLLVDAEDKITIENNLFVGIRSEFNYGDYAILNYGTEDDSIISVQKNSFYTDGKVTVRIDSDGAFDAPNNYWGTTDEEVIKKMIFDLNDDPALIDIIEYMPYLTEPHPDTPVYPGN